MVYIAVLISFAVIVQLSELFSFPEIKHFVVYRSIMKCAAGDSESTRFIRYDRGSNKLLRPSNLVHCWGCIRSCIVKIFLLVFQLNVTCLQDIFL